MAAGCREEGGLCVSASAAVYVGQDRSAVQLCISGSDGLMLAGVTL